MNIGERISDLLDEREITQRQLAEALHLAPTTINGYVKKGREPDYETLQKLASFFCVTIDYLIGYSKNILTHSESDFNEDEYHLIYIYRKMTKDQQELFLEQGKLMVKLNRKKEKKSSSTTSKTNTDVNKKIVI
jgi:transcriptional regulator with XRE-family HTH domain